MKHRARWIAATLLAWGAGPAHAQNPAQCTAVLEARNVRPGPNPCQTLAVMVSATAPPVTRAADTILRGAPPVGSVFTQRDLQARHNQQASLAGSPAQGQGIPAVRPAGLAAGTIAVVGTDAGEDAIAAIALNPVLAFLGDEVTRELARYSRFADLSVFLPVSSLTEPGGTDNGSTRIRYIGARLRLNIHGLSAGDAVWDGARTLILNWISRGGRNAEIVLQAFRTAPDIAECAASLLEDRSAAAVTAACGQEVSLDVDEAEAELLRVELARVRRAADSRYFGADIRFDHGDPTLGAEPDSRGRSLFAGLAWGRRLGASDAAPARWGIQARLGARHATLESADDTELAVEGGVGLELVRHVDAQEINAATALEFRYGNAESDVADLFQTNFVMLRGSVVLPITTGNSISINIGAPITGNVSPVLSVNFNWGLLLPDGVRRLGR